MSNHLNERPIGPLRFGLAVVATLLSLGVARAATEDGYSLLVTVWDDQGNVLPDANVIASGIDGDIKGLTLPDGSKLLLDFGTRVGSLLKSTVRVTHRTWGVSSTDLHFELTPATRLEVVFTEVNSAEVFGPQQVTQVRSLSGIIPRDQVRQAGSFSGISPPENDDCSNATVLDVQQSSATHILGSTAGATLDNVPFACGTEITAPGVWYRVMGTGNTMSASTCSAFSEYDTKLSVFCGNCDQLPCIIGGDDSFCHTFGNTLSHVEWCTEEGQEYLVLVHGFNDEAGPFELIVTELGLPCVAANCASNDDCANAIDVGMIEWPEVIEIAGSTVGASIDDLGVCGVPITGPGVWYRVKGTGYELTAKICVDEFSFDTKLSVFCGNCDTLTCIKGSGESECGFYELSSSVYWCSEEGRDYFVLVHGSGLEYWPFNLEFSANNHPCSDSVACPTTGACCLRDGSCTQTSGAADCAQLNGTYNGLGSECFTSLGSETYSALSGATIPGNDPAGLNSMIMVGDAYTLGDLDVSLSVDHTWVGDLVVTLTHRNTGTSVVLVDRQGAPATSTVGCSAENWVDVVLDDEGGGGAMEDQCLDNLGSQGSPPSYTPHGLLSAFDGESTAGRWILTVSDNEAGDTGSLVSWSMIMRPDVPNCDQPNQ